MIATKQFLAIGFLAMMTAGLSACGDTWDGIKEDVGDNAKAVGEAAEDAGDAIKDATQ